jgi:processive 1,2-diacylglycerol beta-glucosyltransferase
MSVLSENGRYRVLILSASAGSGHVRAAAALEAVCHSRSTIAEVRNVDALSYTNKIFRQFYSKFYFQLMRNVPTLLGWFYDNLDEPWKTERMRLMLSRLNTRRLVRMIRDFDPHLTICTHFLPAEIISFLIGREAIQTRLSIVVTDLDVHAMWLSRQFHRYFVALPESREHLIMTGLPADRITVSGIPVDAAFGQPMERGSLCEHHGIDPARPLVLVSMGAVGKVVVDDLVRILSHVQTPCQVAFICGQYQETADRLRELVAAAQPGVVHFRVVGRTPVMHEWMKMASLLIGKPGGLTVAECMASGLPMLIFMPIPGQEERNSDHLLESGAAVKCNQITTLAFKVDELLADPVRLQRMREAAHALGHPHAADVVVDTLLDQMNAELIRVPKTEA